MTFDPSEARDDHGKWAAEAMTRAAPDAKVSITEKHDGTLVLDKLIVPDDRRGQGDGTKAMDALTTYADKHGKTVALTPSTDYGASSVGRLKTFYKGHGFVENNGRHADYAISESMIREPKKMTSSLTAALTAAPPIREGVESPPADWFTNPNLPTYQRLTWTADGRVTGHLFPWASKHRGTGVNSNVLRGASLDDFARCRVITADGTALKVGALTVGGGHADQNGDIRAAAEHYDNVGTAWALVAAGEDQFGLWVSGALKPGVTQQQLRDAFTFDPSIDYRPGARGYSLVAACSVVVPGLPVTQAEDYHLAASGAPVDADGHLLPLVASGGDFPVTADAATEAPTDTAPVVDPEEEAEDVDTAARITALELAVGQILNQLGTMQASAVRAQVWDLRADQARRIRDEIHGLRS